MNNVFRYFCGLVVLVGASLVPSTCSDTAIGANDPAVAVTEPDQLVIQVEYFDIKGQEYQMAVQF